MHRTQISLEEQQYRYLRLYAERHQQSISAVIRGLLDRCIENAAGEGDAPSSPLNRLKGIASGDGTAVGREHNRYLYQQQKSQEKV